MPAKSPLMAAARDAFDEVGDACVARAKFLRKQIEEIKESEVNFWVARKKSDVQQARAHQLRAEIKRLKKKPPALPAKQENPAAFVHRRMAEWAAEKKQSTKSR